MARNALVTGSTAGIGLAIARMLSSRGYHVILSSSTQPEVGRSLAAEMPSADYVQADLGTQEGVRRLIEEVRSRVADLDVLVNNAGRTKVIDHKDLRSADLQTWRSIFELNVFTPFELVAGLEDLLRRSGAANVVNVASLAGERPTGSSIPYACSKAALAHMTRLLARALGPSIRVNAVAPGLVDTRWTADWGPVRDAVAEATPLRRIASPEDVAQAVAALLDAGFVTGEVLIVDGGYHLVV